MHAERWETPTRRTVEKFTWVTPAKQWRDSRARGAIIFERSDGGRVRFEPVPRSWFLTLKSNTNSRPEFSQLVRAISTGWTVESKDRIAYETLAECQPIQTKNNWTRTFVTTTRLLGLYDKEQFAPSTSKIETLGAFICAANAHKTTLPPLDALEAAFNIPAEKIDSQVATIKNEYSSVIELISTTEEDGGPPCLPIEINQQNGEKHELDTSLSQGWTSN